MLQVFFTYLILNVRKTVLLVSVAGPGGPLLDKPVQKK
jgi:hypothetical protein